MGLTGLEIYKLLPKTNCKECGFPTCLAFAMQIAAKKASLEKCPYVSQEAKGKLESASRPPVNLVTVGTGDGRFEAGNETVLFRHEETFRHPAGIGLLLEDTLPEKELTGRIEAIERLRFERVGQKIEINLIALKNESADKDRFVAALGKVMERSGLNLILMSDSPDSMKAAVEIAKCKRPLIYAATKDNIDAFVKIAKEASAPLVVKSQSLEELSALAQKAGMNDLFLDTGDKPVRERIEDFTYIRRMALKKGYRPFGYPAIAVIAKDGPFEEAGLAATLIAKYAGIVVLKNIESWAILPLLTARQNIYTDPQKPLQVEPRIYEVGQVTDESPVLVTTNFSLTYYTVESEVESSKVPSYIISVDSEGLSVLTAWAAEKFTAEKIAGTFKACGIEGKVKHKEVVIPGYVAVMSGKLQEESGWQVKVGPREASGIPSFLKTMRRI